MTNFVVTFQSNRLNEQRVELPISLRPSWCVPSLVIRASDDNQETEEVSLTTNIIFLFAHCFVEQSVQKAKGPLFIFNSGWHYQTALLAGQLSIKYAKSVKFKQLA